MPGGVASRAAPAPGFPATALEREGLTLETGVCVTGAVASGAVAWAAFGDGALRRFRADAEPLVISAHNGAVLSIAPDRDAGAILTGGDDGRFLRVATEGGVEELVAFGSRWVDHVAASARGGFRACSSGRTAHVWRKGSDSPERLEHPSTVGGLAFDPKGKRLAVAHYGGVTVWERTPRAWKPVARLLWTGSHIGVTWSPDGKHVVSAMQENALHGWRLRDKADMAMSGYPAKARSMAWVGGLPYLATSGAETAVCWPFDGRDGPMGRAPLCVANGGAQQVTCVFGLPGSGVLLAGFKDGAVLLSETREDAEDRVVRGSTGAEVTAMAVTPDIGHLLIGDAAGRVLWAAARKTTT